MITNYYTLKSLVEEWQPLLVGGTLEDAFSQTAGELTLAFLQERDEHMLRIGTAAPFRYLFRSEGYSKARRNVAAAFEDSIGSRVEALSIAHRDRIISIALNTGISLRIVLFGPRANVFLVRDDGSIVESFLSNDKHAGRRAPSPTPAPELTSLEDLQERWNPRKSNLAQAVATAVPLYNSVLAAEAAQRAGLDPSASPESAGGRLDELWRAIQSVETQLARPQPRIYWTDNEPAAFSLIPLSGRRTDREEIFDSVDAAVRVFVRRSLESRRFHQLYDPLAGALERAAAHYRSSADRMLEELSRPSRADQYEKWAHLLMTAPNSMRPGTDLVELPDLFAAGDPVRIPVDSSKTTVENAQVYYERARRTRRSRDEAERRLVETEAKASQAERLLEELSRARQSRDVLAFRKKHEDALAEVLPAAGSGDERRLPFRRFDMGGGYEVWVGRNAKQNDELTFRHAQKHDLWMHARGVPGSHVVLRRPSRSTDPPRELIERAAGIAAHFSKARGSALVPVIVAERKYVRKPRGAAPGTVIVEREDVYLVEPALPERTDA